MFHVFLLGILKLVTDAATLIEKQWLLQLHMSEEAANQQNLQPRPTSSFTVPRKYIWFAKSKFN